MNFEDWLRVGKTGETLLAEYMKNKGYAILPAYEKIEKEFKGPMVFTTSRGLVAPDMFCFDKEQAFWIESKQKNAFTWHRITEKWVTGVDLHHFQDYLQIQEMSPWPVYILFIQKGGAAKGDEGPSPSGLYGHTVEYLNENYNHIWKPDKANKYSRGMIYWAVENLKKIASLEEVMSIASPVMS